MPRGVRNIPPTVMVTVQCHVCGKPVVVREKDLEEGKEWVCEGTYDCFKIAAGDTKSSRAEAAKRRWEKRRRVATAEAVTAGV